MDSRIEQLSAMLDVEAPDIDCPTAMIYVELYVDDANVCDLLKLISSHPKLNLYFWKHVNSAPHSDAGWSAVACFASDGEVAERAKLRLRRMVEIVRRHLDPVSQKRDQLFRR